MQTKNIALLYLNVNNLGDVVIHDTFKYLIERVLKEENIDSVVNSYNIGDKFLDKIVIPKRKEKINDFIEKEINFLENFKKYDRVKQEIILKRYKQSKQYISIRRVLAKLTDADLIVFCGGGLIKYHKQEFHLIINQITTFADKHNIPVIFNAVGIEGYDENNPDCMILKRAINRKCVKAIATRDNLKSLENDYVTNKNIYTTLVSDPAVWSKEAYNTKKVKSDIIGIGLIRPEIFKDYLYDIEEEELLKLFSDLITKLQKKKYSIKLFTNGGVRDQKFILKIKEYMNADDSFDELIEERPKKSDELINYINSYKAVIGVRLHSNIIAYSLDKPTVGLVWNVKQLMFSELNGIEEYFITKENFNADYIIKKIEKAIKEQPKLKKEYKNKSYEFSKYITTQIKK